MKVKLIILLITFTSLCFADSEKDSKPMNILFFLVDDMGWQETSVPALKEKTELNKRFHTPAMERLASKSVQYTQAYATAVCSPSRIGLMTGINNARHQDRSLHVGFGSQN